MNHPTKNLSIAFLGASGAVGTETLQTLLKSKNITQLSLFGRTTIPNITADFVRQYPIHIFDPSTYLSDLPGHTTAICTLGVGEPSKMDREQFIKIDKTAVLDFAKACKNSGVQHFELLAAVGINAKSSNYYLRSKGELVEELQALNFERLSIFQPSMILTPKNRYSFFQGIILKVWPWLKPLLFGSLRKYRGIPVHQLGQAMAKNVFTEKTGYEVLQWDDFVGLSAE